MPYEIGFAPKGSRKVSVTRKPDARTAVKTVQALQTSDEEIRHIKQLPNGHEIGLGELQMLAEREDNSNA